MDIGIITFATDRSIAPDVLGAACEERGFESLWFAEHTHIPTSRKTPFLVGGDLPEMYWRTVDQFVAMTAAAAVTTKLKIGSGVALVTEHDPINLAKRVASLDRLSEGRLLFGIGAGWNVEEMEDHGVAFKDRWKVTRERVLAMRTIWTEDEPEYHGDFVDFPAMWSWPKPVQSGGPPILMGAFSKWVPKRIAEYCDGWMPIDGASDIASGIKEIKNAMREVGREDDSLDVTMLAAASPDRGPDLDRLKETTEIGVNRALLPLPDVGEKEALKVLDSYVHLVESLR